MEKYRKSYLVVTSCTFVFLFIVYGILGIKTNESEISNTFLRFIAFGSMGSLLTGFISGIFLLTVFVKNRSKKIKLMCIFLLPIVSMLIFMGIFIFIPYGIYNIIKIKQQSKDSNIVLQDDVLRKRNVFPYKSIIGVFKLSRYMYILVCLFSLFVSIYLCAFKTVIVDDVEVTKPVFRYGIVFVKGEFNVFMIIIIFCVLLLLFTRLIIIRIIRYKIKQINAILLQECNVEEYIKYYNHFSNFNLRKNDESFIYCSLSTGLIANGDFEEAKNILQKIDITNKKINNQYQLLYNNNFMVLYLFLNDFNNAEKHLENMKNLKHDFSKKNKKIQKFYNTSVEHAIAIFNTVVHKEVSTLQYFEEKYKEKTNLYKMIMAKYYIYIIYTNLLDEINIDSSKDYIIENGKNLFVGRLLQDK